MQEQLKKAAELCNKEEFDQALKIYNDLIASQNHPIIFYQRAKAYFYMKQYDKAIMDMNLAVELSPQDAEIISERALCYHMMGESNKAMADFDTAVDLEPHNAFRYASRAFIKDRLGDLKGAISDYKKSLELDPENAITYNNLGIVYEKLGNKKQAQQNFDSADQLDPEKFGQKSKVEIPTNKEVVIDNSKIEPIKETTHLHNKQVASFFSVIKLLLTSADERKSFWKFIKGKLPV